MWICINVEKWLNKKSCNLTGWEHFGPYLRNLDLCRKTENINFHYRTNSVKINDKIFEYIQKTLFLARFPNFGGKKFFSGKSHGFLAPLPKLRKRLDRRTDGRTARKDGRRGRLYFIGPFRLPPGGPKTPSMTLFWCFYC